MYEKYLISNTKSLIEREFTLLQNTRPKLNVPELPGFMSPSEEPNHRIYRFPNGHGASVIKGFYTMNQWEIAEIVFEPSPPLRKRPKKKRLRKKWASVFMQYDVMTNDIARVDEKQEIHKVLLRIMNR